MKPKAVVLLSGGLDSATCLYDAIDRGFEVIALSFFYNQSHLIELEYAKKLVEESRVAVHLNLKSDLDKIGGSALTTDTPIPKGGQDLEKENHIPATYVPGRNIIFLSLAAATAEANGAHNIFIGVNALDYSGYPDCRPDFIRAFTHALNLGTKQGVTSNKFTIHTPLIDLTKAQIVEKGNKLNVPYELTWSCYDPQKKDSGEIVPCMQCDSCLLRQKGFADAGLLDPAIRKTI